jgi:Fur family transcriptional regulator, zinc uptake regulator
MRLSIETSQVRASRGNNEEQIYDVLLKNKQRSMSAYEILAALKGTSIRAAVQVYRALDRLMAQHRVHRIESLNALVACRCEAHSSPAGFLICESCGATVEFDPAPGLGVMHASVQGFHVQNASVELQGLCTTCLSQKRQAS